MTSSFWLAIAIVTPFLAAENRTTRPTNGGVVGRAKPLDPQVVRPKELWRIGEDDDAEALVFGAVGPLLVDRERQLYVLDPQAQQVSVFSAQGEFVRTIGRIGEGPGEFREPRGLVLMPDGSIGVVREQPPAILRFRASDGSFIDNFYLTEDPSHPFQRLHRVVCRGRTLVAIVADIRESPAGVDITARLVRFDGTGNFVEQYDSSSNEINFAKPAARERYDIMWQVGPDERVVVNHGLDYYFDVYHLDGSRGASFGRGYEPLPRTKAEIDSVKAFYRRVGNIGDATLEVFDRVRDVAWFGIDDDGETWVLSSRGRANAPEDSIGLFDIYDSQGALRRTIDLKGEGGPRDGYLLHGDRLYVVRRETLSVIAYRVEGL
jgi:hypothetical protein